MILAALAEPTRLAAIRMLHDGSEHCVCDLMSACELHVLFAAALQHLSWWASPKGVHTYTHTPWERHLYTVSSHESGESGQPWRA